MKFDMKRSKQAKAKAMQRRMARKFKRMDADARLEALMDAGFSACNAAKAVFRPEMVRENEAVLYAARAA